MSLAGGGREDSYKPLTECVERPLGLLETRAPCADLMHVRMAVQRELRNKSLHALADVLGMTGERGTRN